MERYVPLADVGTGSFVDGSYHGGERGKFELDVKRYHQWVQVLHLPGYGVGQWQVDRLGISQCKKLCRQEGKHFYSLLLPLAVGEQAVCIGKCQQRTLSIGVSSAGIVSPAKRIGEPVVEASIGVWQEPLCTAVRSAAIGQQQLRYHHTKHQTEFRYLKRNGELEEQHLLLLASKIGG